MTGDLLRDGVRKWGEGQVNLIVVVSYLMRYQAVIGKLLAESTK